MEQDTNEHWASTYEMEDDPVYSSDDIYCQTAFRVTYGTEDIGTYEVTIPWNHITDNDWKQAAVVAGDRDWKDTKRLANEYPIEAIELCYSDGKLQMTQYHIAWRGPCGYGYKGGGMTNTEKEHLEHHFREVESEKHVYVFVRR
jgi:hypothetical protein